MSRSDDAEFAEFFRQQHSTLVRFLVGRGASLSDAEDAVQTVFTRVFARWAEVHMPRVYLYQAVKNEVAALARRQWGDLDSALRWAGSRVERSASEDVYHQGEIGIVRDSLAILPPRQREVMAKTYAGYRVSDIAEALGISASTVRSNRRHGCEKLRPLVVGDGQDLHWRAGKRLYEAWQRGDTLPAAPRPVIGWAWDQAKALGVDPEHDTAVVPLGPDEVKRRRSESPLVACS
jgi:RNA polymerase sigma factor (sigma-70 family)